MRQSNYIKIAPKIPPRSLLEHHIGRGLTFMEISRICDVKAAQLKAALAFYQLECPPSPQRSELRRLQLREAGYSWEQVSILCPETLKTFHTIGKLQWVEFTREHRRQLHRLISTRKLYSIRWNAANAAEIADLEVTSLLTKNYAQAEPSHRNIGAAELTDSIIAKRSHKRKPVFLNNPTKQKG